MLTLVLGWGLWWVLLLELTLVLAWGSILLERDLHVFLSLLSRYQRRLDEEPWMLILRSFDT